MIRVLQCVNIMDRAGLENMLMNYYRNIDKSKIQFDFLTHREEQGSYDVEINNLGGIVYHAPRLYPKNYFKYYKWMKEFFKEHPEYTIIHSHIDAMSFFPLLAAKISNIPYRIAHSHSSKLDKDYKIIIKYLALKLVPKVSNYYCACGLLSGKFMFKNRDFRVINNAVDVKSLRFNSDIRRNKRKEIGISDKFVIGHVGRFCYIKNQLFLLDVFKEVKQKNTHAHLLLIGKGEDETKIINKIDDLNLKESVTLLKDRDDVADLYQTMDIFVMPSLFEGLPLVGVEAQANGLPCLFSDKISNEVLLLDTSKMLKLEDGAKEWAEKILKINCDRMDTEIVENIMKYKGFDITTESSKLLEFYSNFIKDSQSRKEI